MFDSRLLISTLSTAAILLPIVGANAYAAPTQDQEKAAPPASKGATTTKVKSIRLKHVGTASVVNAIHTLGLPVTAATTGTNLLLLSGTEKDLKTVTELVIRPMDVPETPADSNITTHFIRLGRKPTKELLRLVQTVLNSVLARFAADPESRMLVMRGTDEEAAAVRALLKEVSHVPQALTLDFFFLRARIEGAEAQPAEPSDGAVLPAVLRPVAKTLEDSGFGSLSLMSPITVFTDEGQEFESLSRLQKGFDLGRGRDDLQFSVQGVARMQPDRGTVQLTIEAGMNGTYARSPQTQDKTLFHVETTIATKLGSYVVLAASPSSTAKGDAVALVVRVTK